MGNAVFADISPLVERLLEYGAKGLLVAIVCFIAYGIDYWYRRRKNNASGPKP